MEKEKNKNKKDTDERRTQIYTHIVYSCASGTGTSSSILAVSSSCTTKLNHLNCLTKYLKFHRLIYPIRKTKTTTKSTTTAANKTVTIEILQSLNTYGCLTDTRVHVCSSESASMYAHRCRARCVRECVCVYFLLAKQKHL